ncbi:helix-turn-helix domain-containing protein [Ramlibacter montanisoli]|uniref:Helix-turn-helix domain-containing protein n=1 Tax=Ramlibacter montanisoli TaxID=2732512 RepID=A0A849K0G4_9BURK|nr:helix-turn-helix domain-containing protein [Ramlibacter montanisoli]
MIAQAVGCSIRSLEAAFREWRQTTPTQYYRRVRLDSARAELLLGSSSSTVSTVALHHGFPPSRASQRITGQCSARTRARPCSVRAAKVADRPRRGAARCQGRAPAAACGPDPSRK